MRQKNGGLTKKAERAAQMVAEDEVSDEQIANRAGVSRQTLGKWKRHPVFAARVEVILAEYREKIVAEGIANKQNRVDALNDRWYKMGRVIAERATDSAIQDVPGGKTGLVIRQLKQIGAGREAQVVEEYAVDTALLKELRAHEQQAATEVGQWTEKQDVTSGGQPLKMEYTISFDE